jgi:hypothetical protein
MWSAQDDVLEISANSSSCIETQKPNKREPKMRHEKPQSAQSMNHTRFELNSIRMQGNAYALLSGLACIDQSCCEIQSYPPGSIHHTYQEMQRAFVPHQLHWCKLQRQILVRPTQSEGTRLLVQLASSTQDRTFAKTHKYWTEYALPLEGTCSVCFYEQRTVTKGSCSVLFFWVPMCKHCWDMGLWI